MDPGFEVEGAMFEELSSVRDNRSGRFPTNNSRILPCYASKEIQFPEVFDCPVFAEKLVVWEITKGGIHEFV